jgi:hypothetical protein
MPVRSDEPLRKVTLNLYEADCQWLEKEYGRGWTERIRQHIHDQVYTRQQYKKAIRTIGDLHD